MQAARSVEGDPRAALDEGRRVDRGGRRAGRTLRASICRVRGFRRALRGLPDDRIDRLVKIWRLVGLTASQKHPMQIRKRFPKPEKTSSRASLKSARPNRSTDEPSGFGFKVRSFQPAQNSVFSALRRSIRVGKKTSSHWLSINVLAVLSHELEKPAGAARICPNQRSLDPLNAKSAQTRTYNRARPSPAVATLARLTSQ